MASHRGFGISALVATSTRSSALACQTEDQACARQISSGTSLLQLQQAAEKVIDREECASTWSQCGGQAWSGSTCCTSGSSCQVSDEYYSQCLPQRVVVQAGQMCSDKFAQCGGIDWQGPSCCNAGSACEERSAWYSQCKPASVSASTPEDPSTVPVTTPSTSTEAPSFGTSQPASCSDVWGQCGGKDWQGPYCCKVKSSCVKRGEWYSQCKPGPDTSTQVPSTSQPAVPTVSSTTETPSTQMPQPSATTTTAPLEQSTTSSEQLQPTDKPLETSTALTASETQAPTEDTTTSTLDISTSQQVPTSSSGVKTRGILTMWSTQESLIGAQCEYANAPVGSLSDPVLSPYLRKGHHCAIGDANPGFGRGEHCGKCYRITSLTDDGAHGTPGKKGSAVVTVSDGGAGGPAHFDCILEGFQEITGAQTGVFDVDFEEVVCEDVTGNPVIINWADRNAYYCKMMFENIGHWGQLQSVRACLDGEKCKMLEQFSGATWTGCPEGNSSSMTFDLTQRSPSGAEETIMCTCEGAWPWPTGERCSCPTNFGSA